MGKTIAVVGSNMVDLITYIERMPREGETVEAPSFSMGFGGKGANQAVAAARLGASVMMVTKVGDDLFGPNTRDNLGIHGIDTRFVWTEPGTSSGVAPIFVDPKSSNSILIVKGANAHLLPADIDRVAEELKNCALIVMQLEIPVQTVYHVLHLGAKIGVPTLLNPAPAQPDLDLDELSRASFLVPNESELEIMTGMPVETVPHIEAAARSLTERGIGCVVVTMGARGALLVTKDGAEQIACPAVPAKDTTGAGDAFIGSFARYYVDGLSLRAALKEAACYASNSIMKLGTQKSYADRAEFEAFKKTL